MGNFEEKLANLGVTLPDAPAPAANYVPYVQVGDMLYVSGQISKDRDRLITGKLGDDMDAPAGARGREGLRDRPSGAGQGRLRRRSRPSRAGRQADWLRQFHRRFHRAAPGDQRRLGFPWRGPGRNAANTRAPQCRPRRCHSAWLLKSKAFSRSDDQPSPGLSADCAAGASWPARRGRRSSRELARRDPCSDRCAGMGSRSTCSCRPTACAMVFHDYDLARLTEADRRDPSARGGKTLDSIALPGRNRGRCRAWPRCWISSQGSVPLLVELKDQHGQMGPTDGRLEGAVAAALCRL